MYAAGYLSGKDRSLIVAQRPTITAKHFVGLPTAACGYSFPGKEYGIGVDFPL